MSSTDFLGQPKGLPVLISLKVWELFSYQGMRAFLVFYLIDAFALHDDQAALIFGSYAALVLSFSVLGGYCADRWLGAREPMALGAGLIMAGHCSLALENFASGLRLTSPAASFQIFCFGLALISVGTGLLKPNVLTMIGRLYRSDDRRRDFGYYSYYVGINIGGFLAPIVCGGLASHYGWAWGFGAAAIGMAFGLITFIVGRRLVKAVESVEPATRAAIPRARIYLMIAVTVGIAMLLVQNGVALGLLLTATVLGGAVLLVARARASEEPADLRRVLRFFLLIPVPAFFELLFEQLSTTVNLYSERAVERSLFTVSVTAPQLLSLNSFFVLVLLPLLAALWARLARHNREPAAFTKFSIGFGCIAAAFVVLALASGVGPPTARISLLWVIGAYLAMTLGELCIAPPTFALVGKMVPDRYAGIAMGLALLGFAGGSFLASLLAGMVTLPKAVTVPDAKAAYRAFFIVPALVAFAFAAVCVAIRSFTEPARHAS